MGKPVKTILTNEGVAAALVEGATGKTVWRSESFGRCNGALVLRVGPKGAHWYYRYATGEGTRSDLWPLGPYGKGGLTLAEARTRAYELMSLKRRLPDGNLRGHFEREKLEARARLEAEERARRRQQEKASFTLRALVEVYTSQLEQQGKIGSAKDARLLLTKHVLTAFPQAAEAPARELTRQQVTRALRAIVEAGKGRTAGKVRSYLRAAFALALRADSDPSAPSAVIGFEIQTNPVADTASLSAFNKPRHRALSEAELRALWERLKGMPGVAAEALQVALLTGGQRMTQLLRATTTDFNADLNSLTLYDPKGRRQHPRRHVVPVPPKVSLILKERAALARAMECPWLFTATGKTPTVLHTVEALVTELSAAMTAAGEAEPFRLSDLRRTAETHLARLGVSRDIRAQVQSHGLAGVQMRNYDCHDYLEEKRSAISAWAGWLTSDPSTNVVPIRA